MSPIMSILKMAKITRTHILKPVKKCITRNDNRHYGSSNIYFSDVMTNVIFFSKLVKWQGQKVCPMWNILQVLQGIITWNTKAPAPTVQNLLHVVRLKFQIYRMTDSCRYRFLFYAKNKLILQTCLRMYD